MELKIEFLIVLWQSVHSREECQLRRDGVAGEPPAAFAAKAVAPRERVPRRTTQAKRKQKDLCSNMMNSSRQRRRIVSLSSKQLHGLQSCRILHSR